MRIAIIGTGGVGGYLGAKFWKASNDVVFVARGNHLASMQKNGLQLKSPEGNFAIQAIFTDRLNNLQPFDLIIIGVKSFDTEIAAKLALPGLKDDTIVLSIQNGVENHALLYKVIEEKHILPGIAYIISTIESPGVILHEGGTGKFKFGEFDGRISERCIQLQNTFIDAGINGEAIDNVISALWLKWIFICGLGGMTAYSRKSVGEILVDSKLKSMLVDVIHETTTIGRAKHVDEFTGVEEKILTHYQRLPSTSTSSMHYDLTHGKRLEIEALNGAAVRFAKELNIPVPVNEKIYNRLKPFSMA